MISTRIAVSRPLCQVIAAASVIVVYAAGFLYMVCILLYVVHSTWSTVVPATRGHCRFGAKVSPRGRWSFVAGMENVDTHINGHTSIAHIVYALLMHTQNRYGGNEHREIASPNITTVHVRPYSTGYATWNKWTQ